MRSLLSVVVALLAGLSAFADDLRPCGPNDFHYEYTECDSSGGRWLVSVPMPDTCVGGQPEPPVRGRKCDYTCKAGEYLDLKHGQECEPCPAGHYSLGGGIRYDSWEDIPSGFSLELEEFSSPVYGPQHNTGGKVNCTGVGWLPRDKYLMTDLSECTSVLVYVVDLVRPGSVTFTYQYSDDTLLFIFEVQNSKCQTIRDKTRSRYLKTTDEGVWGEEQVPLNSGVNRLYWRAFSTSLGKPKLRKNVMIQKIEVMGVAFTSECTSCPAGTYSEKGSSFCLDCPANTYSIKGAQKCTDCNLQDEYSDVGSSACLKRKPCTVDDYFDYNTPCDKDGLTQKMHKWIDPLICSPSSPDSAKLPLVGPLEKCPPCNPGMQMVNGKCEFCPANHHSDGIRPCESCPGSTAAETGILFQWWNNLPADANLSFFCLSPTGKTCAVKDGWTASNDHIRSLKGNQANAYAIVSLHVAGFRGGEQAIPMNDIGGMTTESVVFGTISFVFELICEGQCSFLFIQHAGKQLEVINSWTGNTPKTKYLYNITSALPANFSWSFQQQVSDDDDYSVYSSRLNDVAKIYIINVTNTERGGADHCRTCPKGTIQDRCIPCPEGTYVDTNTTQCAKCPANTVIRGINAWGIESCMKCGEGLEPFKNTTCVTRCSYKNGNNSYDFLPLAGVHTIEGPHLFTTSGYKYYHTFNISLCYQGSNGIPLPLATCYSNVSKDQSDLVEDMLVYQLPVCRSTILPSSPGDPTPPISINPISLSDVLLAVTNKPDKFNLTEMMKEAKFYSDDNATRETDVHFIYSSDAPTKACRNGRHTIITLRCDMKDMSKDGKLMLPAHCPDGTCDGCNFLFLWTSAFACPVCSKDDYTEFKENCIDGKQRVIKRPMKVCYGEPASIVEVECSIFWQDNWPLWLKVVIILVPVIILVGLILFITVCYCWTKNRKLKYKYMKLIQSTGEKDGELPGVETCALDDGEEDDQFDAVDFKKKTRFFGKFAVNVRRGKENSMFESVGLSEKSPLT